MKPSTPASARACDVARSSPPGRACGRRATDCPVDRATSRGGAPRRGGGTGSDRGPVRAQLAPDPPHHPEGAGRRANPAVADTPAAARQAAADRDGVADDRDRVCQRLLQPAPVQRRVQQPLRDAANTTAQEGDGASSGNRRQRHVDPAARVSTAVRLAGILAFLADAHSPASSASRSTVRADRAARRVDGMDPGDAVEQPRRPARRVHTRPDAGAAGAAQPRAGAVRSRRAAGCDRERPPEGPSLGHCDQGESRPARAGRLQRIRDGPARDSRPAGDGESGHDHRRPVRRRRLASRSPRRCRN